VLAVVLAIAENKPVRHDKVKDKSSSAAKGQREPYEARVGIKSKEVGAGGGGIINQASYRICRKKLSELHKDRRWSRIFESPVFIQNECE